MGDMSEYRGIIVTITFLSTLVIAVALIPSDMYIGSAGRKANPPTDFDANNLLSYTANATINFTISGPQYHWFDIGGHTCAWCSRTPMGLTGFPRSLELNHASWAAWGMTAGNHDMRWYYMDGLEIGPVIYHQGLGEAYVITAPELDLLYSSDSNQTIKVYAKCEHIQLLAVFNWDPTNYTLPSDAWMNNALSLSLFCRFDQVSTTFNVWNIIGMLLFFQMPNVHPVLNLLIAIPFWAGVAYIVYILILRAIGAFFGGGA